MHSYHHFTHGHTHNTIDPSMPIHCDSQIREGMGEILAEKKKKKKNLTRNERIRERGEREYVRQKRGEKVYVRETSEMVFF